MNPSTLPVLLRCKSCGQLHRESSLLRAKQTCPALSPEGAVCGGELVERPVLVEEVER